MKAMAIRALGLLLGMTLGLMSIFVAEIASISNRFTILEGEVALIPLQDGSLSFQRTMIACGDKSSSTGFLASDGERLFFSTHWFHSIGEARSYLQSQLIDNPEIVEQTQLYDSKGQAIGERVVARTQRKAIMIWCERKTVSRIEGPTLRHVTQLHREIQRQ